jgi:hypothetical protein
MHCSIRVGAFRNSSLWLDQERSALESSSSSQKKEPKTTTLIAASHRNMDQHIAIVIAIDDGTPVAKIE